MHDKYCILDCHQMCCLECGLILGPFLELEKMQSYQDWSNSSLVLPYARSRRFSELLDALCLGNETRNDYRMLTFLADHNVTSRNEIVTTMKKSNLVDKRYSSVHLFCKCFDKNFVKFPESKIDQYIRKKSSMIRCFNYIETKYFNVMSKGPFFNYRFIASVILQKFGLGCFTKYLKRLQCNKRVRKNIEKLNALQINFLGIDLRLKDTFQMNPISLFQSVDLLVSDRDP